MRPGRELDTAISEGVMGHKVKVKQKELWESTSKGDRPLRKYSKDITAAWEVVEKLSMTLISIEDGQWFVLAGLGRPWKNPAEFLQYIQSGQFVKAGAAVGKDAPLTVCMAALKSLEAPTKTLAPIPSQQEEAGQVH